MVSSDYFNRHDEWWFDTEEVAALIEDLGLEMTGVELDPDSAAELTLGGLLHRHTDNINIK